MLKHKWGGGMKDSRFIFLFIILLFGIKGFSLDLEIIGGLSNILYAEDSENNKEDLYEFKSGLVGLSLSQDLGKIVLIGRFQAQLPYMSTFTDALGSDDYNYLYSMFYWGINSRIGVAYPLSISQFNISIGAVINHDYIYLENQLTVSDSPHIFSLLGNGILVKALYAINNTVSIGSEIIGVINYLSFGNSGGVLKWSNNVLINLVLNYSYKNK